MGNNPSLVVALAVLAPSSSSAEGIPVIYYDVNSAKEYLRELTQEELGISEKSKRPAELVVKSRPKSEGSNIQRSLLNEFGNANSAYAPYVFEIPDEDDDRFSEYGIIGKDDRHVIKEVSELPASAIASILFETTNDESKLCTGAMVAVDAILTAGHCVFVDGWHKNYTVLVGRNVGWQEFPECGVNKVHILAGWKDIEPGYDIALLKLDCKVGSETGFFPIRAFDDSDVGKNARLQGYPAQIDARGRQYYGVDKIAGAGESIINHRIDTTGGMSGSPIWLENEQAIVAVHTHTTKSVDWSPQNFKAFVNHAIRLTPELTAIVNFWVTEPSKW